MAEDMIERAAKVVARIASVARQIPADDFGYENEARGVLLAALDPEDEALVEFVAQEMAGAGVWAYPDERINRAYFRERAQAVLDMLRARIGQGETDGH